MKDLTNDLLEDLEPYDVTMSHWLNLRLNLPVGKFATDTWSLDRAIRVYVQDQVNGLRLINGSVESDHAIEELRAPTLQQTLASIYASTHGSRRETMTMLVVYAAHLAAMTSYGRGAWDRAAETFALEAVVSGEMIVA